MHALVVEPRKEVIEEIEDRLESINHSFDVVTSQRQAREQLGRRKDYSYIILSLDIPVKPQRPSKMKYGLNLFDEMRQMFSDNSLPIIITLDRHYNNTDTAISMLHAGAFVAVKPFEDNDKLSLENAVYAALDSKTNSADMFVAEPEDVLAQFDREVVAKKNDPDLTEPELGMQDDNFVKSEMIFYKNRVELCGVTVCGDSSMLTRRLLDLLKERTSEGKYKAYSGYELAVIADCESGQQGISATIGKFRNKAFSLLNDKDVFALGEIIVNDRTHGYRLEECIEVIEKTSAKIKKNNEVVFPPDLSEVQRKILNYLQINKKASRAELQNKLKMSECAVGRQLQGLKYAELVRCVGKGKSTLWLPVDR